jgi:hypothetical protein
MTGFLWWKENALMKQSILTEVLIIQKKIFAMISLRLL